MFLSNIYALIKLYISIEVTIEPDIKLKIKKVSHTFLHWVYENKADYAFLNNFWQHFRKKISVQFL